MTFRAPSFFAAAIIASIPPAAFRSIGPAAGAGGSTAGAVAGGVPPWAKARRCEARLATRPAPAAALNPRNLRRDNVERFDIDISPKRKRRTYEATNALSDGVQTHLVRD